MERDARKHPKMSLVSPEVRSKLKLASKAKDDIERELSRKKRPVGATVVGIAQRRRGAGISTYRGFILSAR